MLTSYSPTDGDIPHNAEFLSASVSDGTDHSQCPYFRLAEARKQRDLSELKLNSARMDLSSALTTISDMGGQVAARGESFSSCQQILLQTVALGSPDERVADALLAFQEKRKAFRDQLKSELSKAGSDSSGTDNTALSRARKYLKRQRKFENACDEVEKRKEELRIAMERAHSATPADAT